MYHHSNQRPSEDDSYYSYWKTWFPTFREVQLGILARRMSTGLRIKRSSLAAALLSSFVKQQHIRLTELL